MERSASFGEWLSQYRHGLHLQRAELAARIGCAAVTLRKIEMDERRPSRQMAEQLAEQLGIPPEQREIFIRVARGELAVSHLPLPRPQSDAPTNLPNPTTSFAGREREIEQIQGMFSRPEVRLLTLTGAPGVGKTRLALEAASILRGNFPDGVFFIALAPVNAPELVLVAVAHALQMGVSGKQSLVERLGRYLRPQRVLLVMDNFEHVLEAAPDLARLLMDAPHLKLLITSRSALEISGEHRLAVLPLGVPPVAESLPSPVSSSLHYPAVELFIQRARAVKPDLTLTEANLRAIGQICRRLDGLPLAIEFVAARCAFFTPQEILAQLDDRFALLSGRGRDLPARHLTLWQALEWSYGLLAPADQKLFRRLSVFVEGFTLKTAQEVCNRDNTTGKDVVAGVTTLVASSLLERQEDYEGSSRFRMLQTVREYALNQLTESGEAELLRQWHADYYLGLAEAAGRAWDGPTEWHWLRRLVAVRDDLRAALHWAIDTRNTALALRLNAALFSFWTTCSVLSEASAWIEASLTLPFPDDLPELVAVKAKVLNMAGYVEVTLTNYEKAYAFFEQGLALYREVDDSRGIAWSIRGCAFVDLWHAQYPEAEQLFQESLNLCEASGDKWGFAWSLYAMAFLKLAQGDLAQARNSLEQALVQLRQQNMTFGVFRTLLALGYTRFEQDEVESAKALFREALRLNREMPLLTIITSALEGLAMVAAAQGQALRAAHLWGAVEALREVTGEQSLHVFQRTNKRILATARSHTAPSDWATAWAEGRTLTIAQALAEGLEEDNTPSGSEEMFSGQILPL